MAKWVVVTAGRSVSLPLFVNDVVECSDEGEGRLRWLVECPESTHSLIELIAGVISVEPVVPADDVSRMARVA